MISNKLIAPLFVVAVLSLGYYTHSLSTVGHVASNQDSAIPQQVTLSGKYVCLQYTDGRSLPDDECSFGLLSDAGNYYAVNFGQSADAMQQFKNGAHVTAEGFLVAKEALSTDVWQKYNMEGIFTITRRTELGTPQSKIDIGVACDESLTYMTFPDGASAEQFVAECKAGKHPEVFETYKKQMGLGDDATI